MGDRKRLICNAVLMGFLVVTVLLPLSARSAEITMMPIQEAKVAIEQARQAGAEKKALSDLDQARSWLVQAEKVYEDSQSILSRTMKLVVSNEARSRELIYLADMAKTKARIAEAKARRATVLDELKDANKDLADYRISMEVLNKKSAETAAAKGVQAKAEAELKSLEQARQEVAELEERKKKVLEDTQKKLAELEALKQKELEQARREEAQKAAEREKALAEISLKTERMKLQQEKEEAEMKTREAQMAAETKKMAAMEKKMAALEKEKSMLADATKIPQTTVRSTDKEMVISLPAVNIFSSKNEIHSSGKTILDQVGAYLQKHAAGRIVIRGYTDSAGKAAANQSLSEMRAQKIKEYLVVHQNILSSRIVTEGLGSSQPVASNDTEAGRALNRRVEIAIPTGP